MNASAGRALADPGRLAALKLSALLAGGEEFDRLTRLASRILRAPISLVTLVDEDRQYFTGCVGLPEPWATARRTPLSHSFCQHTVASGEPLVIEDARAHPLVYENLAIRDLGVIAYLGIPLVTSDGFELGSFCVADHEPRTWTAEDTEILRDLAASVATEIELRTVAAEAERERLEWRALLDSSLEGVFGMDADGSCTYINDAALRLLGYTAEECLGRNMHRLVHYKHVDGTPYPIEECPIYQAFMSGRDERLIEEVLWRKDGSPVPALYSCSPIMQDGEMVGAVVTVVDISERRRREEALAHRAEQLRSLADAALAINAAPTLGALLGSLTEHARDIIGAHQSVSRITTGDDPAQSISALSLSEKYARWRDHASAPAGSGIDAVVCASNRPVRLTQPELETHPRWRGLAAAADGRPPMRGCLAAPLVAGDGTNIGLIQLSDRTEGEFTPEDEAILVQLAQVASVAIQNRRLLEQATEAVRVRNDFLASVSHDLRTPLTTVKGTAQILRRYAARRAADPDRLVEGLSRIDGAATRMAAQIDDLLDLARLQSGEPLDLDTRPTDLVALARQLADEQQRAGEDTPILVETREPELVGNWDPARIERVIGNLLANAIKYSPDGGEVRIQIRREATAEGEWVMVRVSDQGLGIPAADLPHIFDRFYRAGNVAGRIGGTGIGLASARQIVHQHGGTITAESEEGSGACFTVRLPLSAGTGNNSK